MKQSLRAKEIHFYVSLVIKMMIQIQNVQQYVVDQIIVDEEDCDDGNHDSLIEVINVNLNVKVNVEFVSKVNIINAKILINQLRQFIHSYQFLVIQQQLKMNKEAMIMLINFEESHLFQFQCYNHFIHLSLGISYKCMKQMHGIQQLLNDCQRMIQINILQICAICENDQSIIYYVKMKNAYNVRNDSNMINKVNNGFQFLATIQFQGMNNLKIR
ncbi:unnamed protein product [Paramecium primaurelia]|uniref:Uncharacterized protein n=1 Tax=Paramecium primaurelia TaxID=5886 RepID=A0A8S1KRU0_PARPR|nr:unnamed protein product [Paramecium primaurelia]